MVIIGFLGTVLDAAALGEKRWQKWRPTVSLCQHEDMLVDRLELIINERDKPLAKIIAQDIKQISPDTKINFHTINLVNPWDFEEVYSKLYTFSKGFKFDLDREEYFIHITTGTHVAQICMFLLTEAGYFPAKLLQSSPGPKEKKDGSGIYTIIDLDLSKYDHIAQRFKTEHEEATSFLKSGIVTRNKSFNILIDQIEKITIKTKSPVLLMGPTGAGKSQLARRIYELKKLRHQVRGDFVEINCATLKGDNAMSTLFGHKRGAFTGAVSDRSGLLSSANKGVLFLDEIGELGLDEQAMILRAIEEKRFLPVGSDKENQSDFQLLAGTNRDLLKDVSKGLFREDLLARLNLWTFYLPGLKDRREDIEPNIEYELKKFAKENNQNVTFNKEARDKYLKFALSKEAHWSGNFRDLSASINRMATLSDGARIRIFEVTEEIERLKLLWRSYLTDETTDLLTSLLSDKKISVIDSFDQAQLSYVIKICRQEKSLSAAGRKLFSQSRKSKNCPNDADRLSKYLQRFDLNWNMINPPSDF